MMLQDGKIKVKMYNETFVSERIRSFMEPDGKWRHVAFSWSSKGGNWVLHVVS